MIKCVTFDLDDTLWEIEPVITKAEKMFYKWLEKKYPIVTKQHSIESLRKLIRQTSLENLDIKHDLTKVRILSYTKLKDLYKLPEDMPKKSFDYFMKYRNDVTLHKNVENILGSMKKNYILGTITNGNASLKTIGIEKYFDFEVKASEVGFMKPNPKIFEYALKLTKCKPSEMLHIGDSYDKDIIGAKSVNMNYIWLRHDSKIEKDIKTENIVDNFSQIPESIKKLG